MIIISIWMIREAPFYIVAEYPVTASILMFLIIYFSFALVLSTFSFENRTLDNIRVTIIVLSILGMFPGISFNYSYFKKGKVPPERRNNGQSGNYGQENHFLERSVTTTAYELFFSSATSEKVISKSWDVSEKQFQALHVGDSLDIMYLPKKSDIVDLIISRGDRTFYAKKLLPNR